jgi:hypothetical protein
MLYFSESHSKSDRVLPTRIPLRFKSNSNRLRPPYYLHPTTYPLLPTTIPAAYSLLPAMPTCYLLPTACYLLPRPTTCIALDLLPLPAPYCVCCGPNGRLMPVPHPTTYPLLPTTIPAAYSLLPAMPTCYLLPTACYLLPRPTTCIALDLLPLPAPYCVCCGPKGRLMPVPLNMAP